MDLAPAIAAMYWFLQRAEGGSTEAEPTHCETITTGTPYLNIKLPLNILNPQLNSYYYSINQIL